MSRGRTHLLLAAGNLLLLGASAAWLPYATVNERISVGSAFARAAYGAFVSAAREVSGKGSFSFADGIIGFDEMNSFFKA